MPRSLSLVQSDWPERSDDEHDERVGVIEPSDVVAALRAAVQEFTSRNRSSDSQTIRIRNFRSFKYRLREDLIVTVHTEGDTYVALSHDTGQYGQGASIDDAIEQLCAVLEEYYELLIEEDTALAPALAHHLRFLEVLLVSV